MVRGVGLAEQPAAVARHVGGGEDDQGAFPVGLLYTLQVPLCPPHTRKTGRWKMRSYPRLASPHVSIREDLRMMTDG